MLPLRGRGFVGPGGLGCGWRPDHAAQGRCARGRVPVCHSFGTWTMTWRLTASSGGVCHAAPGGPRQCRSAWPFSFSYSSGIQTAQILEAYTLKADGRRIPVPHQFTAVD